MTQKVMILGLFLVLFLLLLHDPSIFAAATDDPGYYCPVNGLSYTAGSTFQANLNTTLFTHLISNASRAPFATFSIGTGVDIVYAMYYCRGDASLKTCHKCVETAAGRILDVCRFLKQGIVWYRECTLRYANKMIFTITDEDLRVASPVYNTTQVLGNYLDKYKSIFDTGMRNLIDQVANNVSLKPQGFATIRVNLSSFQTLHGVAQCAPVITGMSCERCLDAGLRLMDLWTNTMEFLPACFIGFDIHGFPPPTPPTPSPSLPVGIKVLISLISFVVLLSLVGGFWLYKRRSSKGDPHPPPARGGNEFFFQQSDEYDQSIIEEDPEPSEKGKQRGLARFSYSEVEEMTNGFQKRIGEGGFAVVYYGVLPYSSKEVAVKMFSKNEAPKQFSTEIEVLGRISHKNLVSLLGYCEEGTNLALVYEYMARGDLKALLNEYSDELSWRKRIEIAIDTAQGLDYLHNGCSPPIVHRDVKPANILLNKDFRAMLSDFGFSKIFPAEYVSNLQSRVVGTLGYLDPQYNLTGNVSEKGDIYSFGVVLLELITGKTAIVNRVMNLGQWVRSILERGDIVSILDPSLRQDVSDNCTTVWKTVELAVRCIHLEATERPNMAQIVSELKECLTMMDMGASTFAKTPSLKIMSATLSSRTMSPTPR